jgi:arylsulfatase A-like enzyme/thioredoxin-like negative regulator of GroEL
MAKSKHSRARTTPTAAPFGRRGVLLVSAAVLVALAAGFWWLTRARGPHAVILISIDTLRADRLPPYGYPAGRTPRLTAFARESILFERAFAHAPQTLPSHASMFTGLLPFEHKVRDNLGFTLAPGASTMASMFQAGGFATGGFVSAYVLRPQTGISQGFQHYDATLPPSAADRSPAEILRAGPETLAAAAAWLRTLPNDHVFLFFHIYEPHAPYTPPAEFGQPDAYDGEVAFSDDIVGRLFDSIRERGWYDAATIVVTADHGEGLGDHQEKEHGLFLYNETIRVPLLVKLPGARHGGSRISEPVQHIDLLPTLASLAGLRAPSNLRGRNLAPLFGGRGTIPAQGIYAEAMYPRYHFGWSDLALLTDGRYKFIQAPRPELYDLDRDPGERTNIIGDRGNAAAALQNGLASILATRGVDAPSAVSAEDRSRLAALGYVGGQAPRVSAPTGALPDPKDKVNVLLIYREAVSLVGAGKIPDGLALLRQVLADSPDMLDVWLHVAGANVRLGRLEEAYQAYREVIRRKPDESGALLGASAVLVAMNRPAEARTYAELAIPHAPAAAHQALAILAVSERRPQDALAHADLAAKADPGLPLPAFVRGVLAHRGQRFSEAVPLLLQARDGYATRTSQPSDLNYFIGDSLARLERYRDAEPFFKEELRLYPQNLKAAAGLAMLFQVTGRLQDADGMIQAMLRTSPNPEAYARAAELYQMFGRPDRASAVRAQARERFGR